MLDLSKEIQNYLSVCKDLKGLSPLSLKAYTTDLKQFELFIGEGNPLEKNNILNYIEYVYKRFKPKSAKRKVACVKALYHYMEMEDIIEINPFHKIRIKYKEATVLPKTIPLPYIKEILQLCYKIQERAKSDYEREIYLRNTIIIELLFSTGMRVSEISNLRIKDINLSENIIYIHGKGSKERITCISKELTKLIMKYANIRKVQNNYLFVNKRGNRYSEQSIRNMVVEYTNYANIDMHITPHMFRHTFATALHNKDVDIRYIQQLLGHSSIVTTQIYTHISTNRIRKILETKHPRNTFEI